MLIFHRLFKIKMVHALDLGFDATNTYLAGEPIYLHIVAVPHTSGVHVLSVTCVTLAGPMAHSPSSAGGTKRNVHG